ncbi:FG-GAP repeat protein [Enterovibrio norvegicus]|uniref:FG-GAP repeat protein n=1 Tax=Enterovibrio norvegicus TaxID=188144 RepID=UPI000C849C40|nr:FG-GAP repeat protein [Enterovibrio norvegicus]
MVISGLRRVRVGMLIGISVCALTLGGCYLGEGGDTQSDGVAASTEPPPPAPSALNLLPLTLTSTSGVGAVPVTFNWDVSEGASSYTVCRRNDTLQNKCDAIGDTTDTSLTLSLGGLRDHLSAFFVLAVNEGGVASSNEQALSSADITALVTYFKASNTNADDFFGRAVSLSADGSTLAVGAYGEDSDATGVNGDQTNDDALGSGAVYVYRHTAGVWAQTAYIKASNTGADDFFGFAISISSDGTTLAVGAYGEDSSSTGIDGDQTNNSRGDAGAVYVYRNDAGTWAQTAYIKSPSTGGNDLFGYAVALSSDGTTLAVGAYREDSSSTGTNGDPANNDRGDSGAAYVYRQSAGTWAYEAYIKASNTGGNDFFGNAVSLSADGNTLAVSAYREDSATSGINGDQTSNGESDSGAVYVYRKNGGVWAQEAYIKASNPGTVDLFGNVVSLSEDGNILAVGAFREDSAATGINGDQLSNSALKSGAVYVYHYTASAWAQMAYIKASNTDSEDYFGHVVSLSADGSTLAVGAYEEDSDATGINGDGTNDNAVDTGAVYVYQQNAGIWTQTVYIKASNTGASDFFGYAVSLSEDGTALAVGAHEENSAATGLNGDEADESALKAGSAYLF